MKGWATSDGNAFVCKVEGLVEPRGNPVCVVLVSMAGIGALVACELHSGVGQLMNCFMKASKIKDRSKRESIPPR